MASVRLTAEFEDAGKSLPATNQTPLAPAEVDELVEQLMVADWVRIAETIANRYSSSSAAPRLT
jgi:hypothetical protein